MTSIILTVLFIDFQACEKQIGTSFPSDSINIVGNWKIKNISGGFAGQTYNPNFKYLTIEANGRFSFSNDIVKIANGILITEINSDNELLLKFNLDTTYSMSVINISTYHPKKIRLLASNSLILDDPCCDLFSYSFERVLKK